MPSDAARVDLAGGAVVSLVRAAAEYLLGGPKVGGADEDRLRRWSALPAPQLAVPHVRMRYVVAVGGMARLPLRHDRLLSIGAAGVAQGRLDLADCFTPVLRQRRTRADVLGHGVGGQAQLAGAEPKIAMLDFLDYLGKAPLVVFGAGADRAVLERAVKSILGIPFRHAWLDLAALLPRLFPKAACTTREEWLDRFGIASGTWHDALGDAFGTAQLFLVALDASNRAGLTNAAQLIGDPGRWRGRGG